MLHLVVTSTVSTSGSALGLSTLTSTVTFAVMISPASSSGPVPIVIESLAIHVDWPVVFGLVVSRLMPTSEVMEWALASGVVLTGAGPTVVWVPGARGAIEFVSATMEEQDPGGRIEMGLDCLVHVSLDNWKACC